MQLERDIIRHKAVYSLKLPYFWANGHPQFKFIPQP